MFGINDAGIWLAYVLAFACLGFSIWFGISRWYKDSDIDQDDIDQNDTEK